jgi:hypothetical protein
MAHHYQSPAQAGLSFFAGKKGIFNGKMARLCRVAEKSTDNEISGRW